MNRMKNPVPGGPLVSCVQCPTCQTFVPVSTANTTTTATTIIYSDPAATQLDRTPVMNQPTSTPNVSSTDRRPPIATISTPNSISYEGQTNQSTNYVNPVFVNTPSNISQHETSWRSKFPTLVVLILAIIQLLFTILIFILEIASLAVLIYLSTGVGIWCTIPFLTACILTLILGQYFLFSHQ